MLARSQCRRTRLVRRSLLGFVALAATTLLAAPAEADFHDGFETAEPAWRDAGGDARYKLDRQLRIAQDAHSGQGCEFLEITSSDGGTAIYLSYDVGNAPVIDELTAGLWLRASRSGVQFAARVVFPRTLEPQSQKPVTALVLGTSYVDEGQWRRLTIGDFRNQVEQQARLLRAQLRLPVDTRQAYVDRVLLNVYVGPGKHQFWIDDLELSGIVYAPQKPLSSEPTKLPGYNDFAAAGPFRPISTPGDLEAAARPVSSVVELKGQTLLVRGKQFFPRAIEHQGEPLEFLQKLGFNAVRMRTTPSRETLEEATRLGLWLICPPPQPADLGNPYGAATPTSESQFGEAFQAVLAWDLGDQCTGTDLDIIKRWSEHVRRNDLPRPRPIVCLPLGDVRSLSRQVDVVVAQRRPMGTNFELSDYGRWLRDSSRLARPGTPQWALIQTQPERELARQSQLLAQAVPPPLPTVGAEQIRLMVFEALAAGVRGLRFDSQTPLNLPDEATQTRAAALHLINLELELIDAWASAGTFVTRVPGSEKDVSGALLQIDRGHLLLPMWTGKGAQFVPGQSAAPGLTFVVPGVPESVDVYELSPGGMRPLLRQRVTGGMRVTLDDFSLTSLILLTQDPQVVSVVSQRLTAVSATAVRLQREVTEQTMREAERVHAELVTLAPPVPRAAEWLGAARRSLAEADARLAPGNLRDGYLATRRALRPIALLERAHWQNAVAAADDSPTMTPFAASFATLPEHWRMLTRLRGIAAWQNLLPAGEFEGLDIVVAAGWRHVQHLPEGVRGDADIAPFARGAAAGAANSAAAANLSSGSQYSLRLTAQALNEAAADVVGETPPVWIVSPPVPVRAGEVLRISGWVNVPDDVSKGRERLVVFDSIGGESLGVRFGKTPGWRRFAYFRMAPLDGEVTLTAALGGVGSALLDDVKIEAAR